jgi:hypothetical protein
MAAIGFTYAQQMLYPVLFQISDKNPSTFRSIEEDKKS